METHLADKQTMNSSKTDRNTFAEGIHWSTDSDLGDNAFETFAREGNTPGLTPFDQLGSFGYRNRYLEKMKEDAYTLYEVTDNDVPYSILRYFFHVATFYSFIDFAYMADGTKVVTVWDASRYPAHALYVGGTYRDENVFREGIEWVEIGWVQTQDAFLKFGFDADVNPAATPFDQGGHFLYDDNWGTGPGFETGSGEHPVMEFTERGSALTGTESEFQDPVFPEFHIF